MRNRAEVPCKDMAAFLNKGRFAPLLAGMPVKVILEPKTALRGAAAYLSHHY